MNFSSIDRQNLIENIDEIVNQAYQKEKLGILLTRVLFEYYLKTSVDIHYSADQTADKTQLKTILLLMSNSLATDRIIK